MSNPAAPSDVKPVSSRWNADLWFAWIVLIVYFVTSPREVYNQTLDASNYATYTYFLTHGLQWGVEVLPMPGPLGFVLFGYCYSGELFGVRLIADVLLCAGFSALLLHFFHAAGRGAARWAWLAVMLVAVPMIDDLLLDATVMLSALALLLARSDRSDRWSILGAVLIAFIALIKGTHLMMCGLVFGAVALLGLVEHRPGRVLRPLGVFLLALAAFWLLAGQNLLHLPAHLHGVRQLASGYNETMGIEQAPGLLSLGLALAGLVTVVLLAAGWRVRRSATGLVALLFLTAFAFLKWKHGFTRADGHVFIFFGGAAVIAATAGFFGFGALIPGVAAETPAPWRSRARLALVATAVVFGILGAGEFWIWRVPYMLKDIPARFQDHATYLFGWRSRRAALDAALERVRVNKDLPEVRKAVGRDRIDFFGNEEGILLLNRMNYRPRPMGGGTFNVVTDWLLRKNEAFTADPRTGPTWQLMKLDSIDDRLPTADDGLTLRVLLDCYEPVLMEREYLLLKRVRHRAPQNSLQPLGTRTVRPGELIAVPDPGPDRQLLFTLHAPTTPAGALRNAVFRAPRLEGVVVSARHPQGRRFDLKPALLRSPMLLSPLIEDTLDVVRYFGDGPQNIVRSLTLRAAPGFATDRFELTFYSAPRPPRPTGVDVGELLAYARYSRHNREPVSLVTGDTGIKELDNDPITIVHAPGSITWNLRPGDQQVLFSYGLMPQAYLNGGSTNGVEFNVEVLWPPNDGRIVFQRLLQPKTEPEDQGTQRARVYLPPYEPGAQLRIRTGAGPDNDGAYDQSYVSHVHIKSGPLVPEQFNGLGVVPAGQRLPHDAVAGLGTQPVYLVHAPGELTLNVPAGAQRFAAKIGLLPGAYTGGGKTDGVGFTVFVQSPGGERRQIWSRLLDPTHQPADRGSLDVTVPLPALPAGTQLVLVTDVGPNGDRGWDQSYIEQARFE